MSTSLKHPIALVAVAACFATPLAAQNRSSAAIGVNTLNAPVPAPLLNGKKAFISYELGDITAFPSAYSGGPERAYGEFYSQMKAWGHFDLVLDPQQADLIFAVRFVDSPGLPLPQIRIGISDAKTGVALWGFVEQIDPAFFKKHRDASFSESIQLLVADVQALVTPGATPIATAPAGKTRLSDRAQ